MRLCSVPNVRIWTLYRGSYRLCGTNSGKYSSRRSAFDLILKAGTGFTWPWSEGRANRKTESKETQKKKDVIADERKGLGRTDWDGSTAGLEMPFRRSY